MTIETHRSSKSRAGGLLYSQFYSSIKEIFAAGNVYPFTNAAIETLALDPKLRKTWQHVGAGLSRRSRRIDPGVPLYQTPLPLRNLRINAKMFWHAGGTYRVSKKLLGQIDARIQRRRLDTQRFRSAQDSNQPYYTVSTSTLLKWLRWNINKFCVGFEMVYSLKDRHFVTWSILGSCSCSCDVSSFPIPAASSKGLVASGRTCGWRMTSINQMGCGDTRAWVFAIT